MKRFMVFLCLAAGILLYASPTTAQNVSLGLKGGVNWATVGGSDAENPDALARLIGGGFANVKLNDVVSIQPELLYAQKGAKESLEGVTAKFKLDYLEIPLLLRLQPRTATKVIPHVFFGPAIAFKTGCKASVEDGALKIDVDCDDSEIDLPVKSMDYGIVGGGGADVPVGKAFVVFDLRYTYGLAKIDDSGEDASIKNRAFSAMVGVRFNLGSTSGLALK